MKIKVNHVILNYEKIGHGQPLIMVHGNGEDRRIFYRSVDLLKEYFTCYLIDSRGHGLSSQVKTYHYQDMADDVFEFIKKLDLKDVIYYGYSDGGVIGLLIAIQHPELLKTLIVSGANTNPKGVLKDAYLEMKADFQATHDPLIRLMIKEPNISNYDLRKIQTDTLIIAGEFDVIKKSHTLNIAKQIKNSDVVFVEGEDHGSYIVDNDKIAKIIIDYCEEKGILKENQ